MTGRYVKADEDRLKTEMAMTPQQELGEALIEHLYATLDDKPHGVAVKWVMNGEWETELHAAASSLGWQPSPRPATLFGIPIEIRDDGGVPHLEEG